MDESSFPEKGNQGLLFGKQVRCIRCGRPLSNENSQTLGMGPICAGRAKAEAGMSSASGDIYLSEPHMREKIVLKLIEGQVATNVPNAIGHQRGYGWGSSKPRMDLDVTVRAHQLEPLGVTLDFGDLGATAPREAAIFVPSVDVVEVERSLASAVSAARAAASEALFSSSPLIAFLLPPRGFSTRTTSGLPSFVIVRAQLPATLDAKARPLEIDARADVLTYSLPKLAAIRAASSLIDAGLTLPSLSARSVRDGLAAAFTGESDVDQYDLLLMGIMPQGGPQVQLGYGGSGPTNLAMNIMEIALAHTDYDTSKKVDYGGKKVSALAWSLGHGFKAQFLVHMEGSGGEIEWETALNWIHERMNEEVNFEPRE